MKKFSVWFSLLLSVAALGGLVFGQTVAPVVLLEGGQSKQPIVIAPDAEERVEAAAKTLQTYLKRITGADFPIERGGPENGIFLGVGKALKRHSLVPEALITDHPLEQERYIMTTHAGGLLLVGSSPFAVQHAVWDFLNRLGYRQYFPTEVWEIVPSHRDIQLQMNERVAPAYHARRITTALYPDFRPIWRDWEEKNRLHGPVGLSTSHAYGRIIRDNRKIFAEHPEYYALINGERYLAGRVDGGGNIKFCISNPGLRKTVVDWALRQMKENPSSNTISLDPSDGGNHCECAPCARLGSITDRTLLLANEVSQALRKEGISALVGMYAYGYHSPPPNIRVAPGVIISIATNFIREGFTLEELYTGWAAKGAVLGVREYYAITPWSYSLPGAGRSTNPQRIADNIRQFYNWGGRYMTAETSSDWISDGLGHYVATRALWNLAEVDMVQAHRQDFFQRAFGSVRQPVQEFFDIIDGVNRPRMSEDLVARMYQSLQKAWEANRDPAVAARLEQMILYTRYVELYRNYFSVSQTPDNFNALMTFIYRTQDLPVIHSRGLMTRMPRRFSSDVTDGQRAAWARGERSFEREEILGYLREGVATNQLLSFSAVGFSENLVPVPPQLHGPEPMASTFYRTRARNEYIFYFRRANQDVELKVTGGLIAHYRNRGNVKLDLFAENNPLIDEPVWSGEVPPDGETYTLTMSSPFEGVHHLVMSDGHDMTSLEWPEDFPVAFHLGEDKSINVGGGRWGARFWVPKGTKTIGGFKTGNNGFIVSPRGIRILDFSELDTPAYFEVAVPPGEDGRFWSIESASAGVRFMTVPPYGFRSTREAIIPRETLPK